MISRLGVAVLESGGTTFGDVVRAGGEEILADGALASGSIIESGGYDYVHNEGAAVGAVLRDSFQFVSGAGTAIGTVISRGGLELISSGAVASDTTVSSGGAIILFQGAATVRAVLSTAGTELVSAGGVASGTMVEMGGTEIVANGLYVTISGTVSHADGTTVATVLSSGGTEIVSTGGSALDTVVSSGGVLIVLPGGTAAATALSGGTIISSGVVLYTPAAGFSAVTGPAESLTVSAGGTDLVLVGGTAISTIIDAGGTEIIFAGGVASVSLVRALATELVSSGGASLDVSVRHDGTEVVEARGLASRTTVSSGGTLLLSAGGEAIGGSVSSGGVEFLYSGATATRTLVESGGMEFVYAGAKLVDPTVESGGIIVVLPGGMVSGQIVSGGEVLSSGSVVLYQAGSGVTAYGSITSGLVLSAGGAEYVLSGATAIGSIINAGAAYVFGSAIDMAINNGAEAFIRGSTTGTVISNGYEYVHESGSVVDTTLNSAGFERILSGGVASATQVRSDAAQFVSAGGTAAFTTVSSGGLQYDAGGSIVSSTTAVTATSGFPQAPMSASLGSVGTAAGGDTASAAVTSGTPEWNLFTGTQSYAIPYVNNPFGTQTASDPAILATLGSGQSSLTQAVLLDTGSRGIIVSAAAFPEISQSPDDPSGTIFYWSDGNKYVGFWHDMTVSFPGATGTNVSGPATATVPVFFVQYIVTLAGNWPEKDRSDTSVSVAPASDGIMNFGIGFDRTGEGTTPENGDANQNYNAFLNLPQMQAGTMTAGFILTATGLQLGLTAANTAAQNGNAYAYEKLLPTGFAQVPGSPPDWQAPTGSVTYDGVTYATGQAVIDIGIPNALLSLPGQPDSGTVDDGTTITTNLLGGTGAASYTYAVGDSSDPLTPNSTVQWAAVQPGNPALSENVGQTTLINTGRNAINGFNYLYDATNGYLGLQANGTGAGDVTVNPETVYQGTTTLPDGFDSSFPVQLVDAFDTAASVGFMTAGTATFTGDITGGFDTITGAAVPITLTIGGGDIHLTGSGTYADGVITAGATLDVGSDTAGGGSGITFGAGGGTLAIDRGIAPRETLSGLGDGDFIDAIGIASATATADGDRLVIAGTGGTLTLALDAPFTGSITTGPDASDTGTLLTLACFAAGTRISTSDGAIAAERLRVGDRVTTQTGEALPIIWRGERRSSSPLITRSSPREC